MRLIFLLFSIILYFNCIYASSFEEISDSKLKKLLHFKNNNQIISKHFFLSNKTNPSFKQEFNSLKRNIKNDNIYNVMCNFPARYIWFSQEFKNIPKFDINKCSNLKQYVQSFEKDEIYLVFTSEFLNSPSSAFGHTMLLFKNKNSSLLNAETIHFAGKTENDNFLTYAYKGLTGGYKGYFLREKFFKKIYEYNILEQRYMYLYKLDFTKKEILKLIYHLYELRKSEFKYYFLNENCSTKIIDLLSIITKKQKQSNDIFTLPIDAIKKYESKVIEIKKLIPSNVKLYHLLEKMNKKDKEYFYNIIKNHSLPRKNLSNLLKQSLVNYYTFQFRMFGKSYKNYNDIMKLKYHSNSFIDKADEPLKQVQAKKIGLYYGFNNNEKYLQVDLRPLFISINDIQNRIMQQSEVKILTPKLRLYNKNFKLNELTFLNMKSFTTQFPFYKPASWIISSSINRDNEKDKSFFDNSFSMGFTKNFFNQFFLSTNLGAGFRTNINENKAYLYPSINVIYNFNKNNRLNFNLNIKKYTNNEYKNISTRYTHKLLKNYNLVLEYKSEDKTSKDSYMIGINYNF